MPTDYTYGIPSSEYLEKGDTYTGPFSGNKYIYTGEAWDIVEANTSEPKMAEEKTYDPVATESVKAWEVNMEAVMKDRTSFIQGVAEELKLTLSGKNQDYAPGGEFSNFERSAEFASIEPFELILAQIGIKYTRIDGLTGSFQTPNNESLRDSFLDLAGYAVIAAAWLDMIQAGYAEEIPEDGNNNNYACHCGDC